MSRTETLTVRADELRVGDRWHDAEEGVEVQCFDRFTGSGQPGLGRVYVHTVDEPAGAERRRMRLLYFASEPLTVTRALPPTDEEFEAAARTLCSVEPLAEQQANGRTVAAVLRLLDAERAKVARFSTGTTRWHVVGTWIVEETGEHNCAGGTPEANGAHEPGCGFEPVVDLATLPGSATLMHSLLDGSAS